MNKKFGIVAALLCGVFAVPVVYADEFMDAACTEEYSGFPCADAADSKESEAKEVKPKENDDLPTDPAAYECFLDHGIYRVG